MNYHVCGEVACVARSRCGLPFSLRYDCWVTEKAIWPDGAGFRPLEVTWTRTSAQSAGMASAAQWAVVLVVVLVVVLARRTNLRYHNEVRREGRI